MEGGATVAFSEFDRLKCMFIGRGLDGASVVVGAGRLLTPAGHFRWSTPTGQRGGGPVGGSNGRAATAGDTLVAMTTAEEPFASIMESSPSAVDKLPRRITGPKSDSLKMIQSVAVASDSPRIASRAATCGVNAPSTRPLVCTIGDWGALAEEGGSLGCTAATGELFAAAFVGVVLKIGGRIGSSLSSNQESNCSGCPSGHCWKAGGENRLVFEL